VIKTNKQLELFFEFLQDQGVSKNLISDLKHWRNQHPVSDPVTARVKAPSVYYYGADAWSMCIATLLEGENLLLVGPKATGKNVLANNLCFAFGRPQWDVSFHVNTDSSTLIGTDTFIDNQVRFRPGAMYECATYGGFGVLDEINMAKNDAIAVLHSILDHRKAIDVPGYTRLDLHEASRFIGTMNYGYAGTKELNEALVSRFMVVEVRQMASDEITMLLSKEFPGAKKEILAQFAGIFSDLQIKAQNSEISTKCVDLRGIIAALKTIRRGLDPHLAIKMGITNKSFDEYEKQIVQDTINTRIPRAWKSQDVFGG